MLQLSAYDPFASNLQGNAITQATSDAIAAEAARAEAARVANRGPEVLLYSTPVSTSGTVQVITIEDPAYRLATYRFIRIRFSDLKYTNSGTSYYLSGTYRKNGTSLPMIAQRQENRATADTGYSTSTSATPTTLVSNNNISLSNTSTTRLLDVYIDRYGMFGYSYNNQNYGNGSLVKSEFNALLASSTAPTTNDYYGMVFTLTNGTGSLYFNGGYIEVYGVQG